MLRVNYISNVNNTLKSNLSFKAGVQTNYGVKSSGDNIVENGVFTGFVGILKDSPFFSKVSSRAQSIEKGLKETKLDVVA